MRTVSKSEATGALRQMFGPETRIARIHRAGVEGYQVLSGDKVLAQMFENLHSEPWRRLVRACMPLFIEQRRREM